MLLSVCFRSLAATALHCPCCGPSPVLRLDSDSNMLVTDLKCFLLCFAAVLAKTCASEQTPHSVSQDVQDLRARYSASAIVRDLGHIKKDLSKVLHLAQVGELNTEETTFYFMRMHDFDDNNMLDGLEIMQAFEHLMEHNNQTFDDNALEGKKTASRNGGQPSYRGHQPGRFRVLPRVGVLRPERQQRRIQRTRTALTSEAGRSPKRIKTKVSQAATGCQQTWRSKVRRDSATPFRKADTRVTYDTSSCKLQRVVKSFCPLVVWGENMALDHSARLLAVLLLVSSWTGIARSDSGLPGAQTAADAEAIRKKYGAKDFVRDMEHLKEDLAKITELQMEGKLTDEEMVFYFFRMHDFDDNNLLDGLELLAAIKHTEEHQVRDLPAPPLDNIIAAVDAMLELDKDHDGYLNYFELRSST